MATPKPHPGYNNPWSLMTPRPRPPITSPAAPTAFSFDTLHRLKPVKPTSPTLPSLIPLSNRPAGPEVLQETGWPIRGNFIIITVITFNILQRKNILSFAIVLIISPTASTGGHVDFEQPTPEPLVSGLLETGGAGMKPHITMLNSASVSVLAEGDVFLPCKAAGNPKPIISWTKVSTGKIRGNKML